MKRVFTRQRLVNAIGAVGYVLMTISFTLLAAAVFMVLFKSGTVTVPNATTDLAGPSSVESGEPAVGVMLLGYTVTVVMVVVSLGALVAMPYLIGKWGSRCMHWLVRVCKIDQARKQLFLVKSAFAAFPLLGFVIVSVLYQPTDMTLPAAHILAIACSVLAIAMFFVQHFLARRYNVSFKWLW